MILLNVLDLLVCVSGVVLQCLLLAHNNPEPSPVLVVVQVLNFILLEATGFVTCLLSTTRCIIFREPLRTQVKKRVTALSFVGFVFYLLVRNTSLVLILYKTTYLHVRLFHEIYFGFLLTELGLMVLVVLLVNTICMYELRQRTDEDAAYDHATITVAILSAFFCVLNTFYIVTMILYFFYNLTTNIVVTFGIFFAVPFNSATNPLIYLMRKKKMREYIQNIYSRIYTFMQPRREIEEGVTLRGVQTINTV